MGDRGESLPLKADKYLCERGKREEGGQPCSQTQINCVFSFCYVYLYVTLATYVEVVFHIDQITCSMISFTCKLFNTSTFKYNHSKLHNNNDVVYVFLAAQTI